MKWETIVLKENSLVEIPDDWLFPHYYEALMHCSGLKMHLEFLSMLCSRMNLRKNGSISLLRVMMLHKARSVR